MRVHLHRARVKVPGTLQFNIIKDSSYVFNPLFYKKNMFYELITEFKPDTKELSLKDYIKIAGSDMINSSFSIQENKQKDLDIQL